MAVSSRSRKRSRKRSRARSAARSRTTARRSGPGLGHRLVEGHEVDLLGLAVMVVALVAALGIYFDVAGPLGRGLDKAAGAVFGIGRFLTPPALLGLGLVAVRGARSERGPKLFGGVVIAGLAGLGLLHLTSGPDAWPGHIADVSVSAPNVSAVSNAANAPVSNVSAVSNAPVSNAPGVGPADPVVEQIQGVRGAGGWVGATVAQPLRAMGGGWGASLILVAVGLAGLLLWTGASLARVLELAGHGARPVGRATLGALDRVTTLARDRAAPSEPDSPRITIMGIDDVYRGDPDESDDELDAELHEELDDDGELDVRGERDPGDDTADGSGRPVLFDDDADHDGLTVAGTVRARGTGEQLEIDLGPATRPGPWKLPSLTILDRTVAQEVNRREIEEGGRALEGALASHGVETRLVGMTVGPTVTRYELELGPGVKVARVTALNKDIAYAMAAVDVRILAPIPGRSAIGIEVPNRTRHLVALGDILTAPEAVAATHPLEVGVGRDIAGRSVMLNLASTPHMLVAGATGAGKSSFINSLVTSLLMRSTPDQVRLILIDPKRVEMGQYNRLPHLLTQVVTSPKKAANALAWAVKEMERRYDLLHEAGVRDVAGYNGAFDRGEIRPEVDDEGTPITVVERLPFIVVVVDELNDLMMVAARDVEESITRIAQMARAVGIHLVVATQRPSVNVITGVIKANIPTRVAFAVSSQTDSKVILDQVGAERLIGKGDMLYLGASSSVAQRIQGAWVGEDEVRKVTAHWRKQTASDGPTYVTGVEGDDERAGNLGGLVDVNSDDADDEQLVRLAIDHVVRSQLGSTSMLQRKLKVGFARAGRIMDLLEQRGVVGPSEGSKARAVLMTVDEYQRLLDNDS
jgi:DNA segregation ATPase FtsK/SpoIIIE, S-DNA-T family